jgi:hypothetical protein
MKRKKIIYNAYARMKKLNDQIKFEITLSFKRGIFSTTIDDVKRADFIQLQKDLLK